MAATAKKSVSQGKAGRAYGAGQPRSVGRPRSEETRKLILQSTLTLLETETLSSITIEAIAKEAGVGKATIYRWWESKALLVIDAFMEHHIVSTPMRSDLGPVAAITQHMRDLVEQYKGWGGRIVAQILAEGVFNPDVGREFRTRFHYGRRAVVREVLEQWRSTGQVSSDTDIEMLMDVLYGPIYMRLIVGHAPLDDRFVRDLQQFVFSLLGLSVPDLSKSSGKASKA